MGQETACSSITGGYYNISTCFFNYELWTRPKYPNKMDVMCCMPLDKKGISSVCVLLCRIVTGGEKKDVWRLTLENVSTAMKPEEKEREQSMYKDVSSSPSHSLKAQSRIEEYSL